MQARTTYCAHCAEPVSLSETGTLQDAEGLSYCAKAPSESPSHAPETKPQALRRLARETREEAEERKGREDAQRFSIGRRDARALEEQAEALEHEAAHFETRSHEASLAEALSKLRGDVYEVEREDCAGFSALGYSSLRSRETGSAEELERATLERGALFVFVSEHATGSDYGGSGSIGKANLRDLLEVCKSEGLREGLDYWELDGTHGSYGLALRFDVRSSELVRVLEGLEDYPCASEETLSEVEIEEESEAWEACYSSDFKRSLASEHALDLDSVEDSALFELFRTGCDRSNTYWEHSSEGASIDLERVCESLKREDVLGLEGAKREAEDVEADSRVCERLPQVYEALRLLQLEASEREGYRSGARLEEREEALRVALGSPSSLQLGDVEGFLAQVARWPVSEHAPAESATPEELRAALALLRSHVGSVVRGAREELERFAPARFKRETERGGFRALPSETPKRD